MAASNQAHYFYGSLTGFKAPYQRGHSAQYSSFKLATSTFVLSILEFIATSHKHCSFTITKSLAFDIHL